MRRPLVGDRPELGQRQHRDRELRDQPGRLPGVRRPRRQPPWSTRHASGWPAPRHSRAVATIGGEEPDVVADMPLEMLPALQLDQHVGELVAASGVDRADHERGHVRVLAQVALDPVREHRRRRPRDRRAAGPAPAARGAAWRAGPAGPGYPSGRHAPQYGVRSAAAMVSRPPRAARRTGSRAGSASQGPARRRPSPARDASAAALQPVPPELGPRR